MILYTFFLTIFFFFFPFSLFFYTLNRTASNGNLAISILILKILYYYCYRNVWSRDRVHLPPLPQPPPPPPPQPALPVLPAPQRPWARGQVRSHLELRWSWPPNWALLFPSSRTKTFINLLLLGSSRVRPTTAQVSQMERHRSFQ